MLRFLKRNKIQYNFVYELEGERFVTESDRAIESWYLENKFTQKDCKICYDMVAGMAYIYKVQFVKEEDGLAFIMCFGEYLVK